MDIRQIELRRQQANILFKEQRIGEALDIYQKSLAEAMKCVVPGTRNYPLEEQLSLLTYNICIVYYRQKNFPKSLVFGLESLKYLENDKTRNKICAVYLRLGMIREYKEVYERIMDKSSSPEISSLLSRMKLDKQTVEKYLERCITLKRLQELSKEISEGKVIPTDILESILEQGESVFLGCENVVYVESDKEVLVFGDTHGQYFDIVGILNKVFDGDRVFIFNGDYVDRGAHSVENFVLLLSLKILFPKRFYLTRGNHELLDINKVYGFYDEVRRKYPFSSSSIYQKFQNVFKALPISVIVNEKVFITHGGLPGVPTRVEDLQKAYRMTDSHADELLKGFLWSDPEEIEGIEESKRRAGVVFGADVTERFLEMNRLDLLIRSHQAVENGYKAHHGGRLVTVFSAPYYEGSEELGSYLILNPSEREGDQTISVSGFTRYRVERFGRSSHKEVLKLLCD
ncbi:Ser/Thr protein phosphatase PP1-1 gamma catalytic subunit [Encephalitozoon intestinalis ATCC 50506]|uniref:Ser/Thr protein phosphatase PP1-1 gamma catalytic subunit n=1 Tax=Encephalitozoon intestinalis (strain ATCC 50506) TaxID=876142 RepID=E0S765_ENCIT|nr:Ser/Thr protein phosphatase PP1-1 gamma catalytic subunit [Encephalitozoon intestinalis ATCC 50506]ADM11493.1 Ser/Thr protein phosphatase PP1-1 gamma catalytic subunit [Encephalitozoon intestinalis ATCC 50506]UTX45205.1 serine/threonine protein phosphatase [Encephalitozoon intestinalis]